MKLHILPQSFYNQSTLDLAQKLLGQILVKETAEGITAGYIVETEGYLGQKDQAAHGFKNRKTARTEILFAEAGHVYTHTMHRHCLVNVVSGEADIPESVLIRAVEPILGIPIMRQRRGEDKKERDLTNGPGKLCQALGITMDDYGKQFTQSPIYIAQGIMVEQISCSPRIGIDNSGEAKDYPWRYYVEGNEYVSKR
ncbi:DNA-3-methyladenine glycosylase [Paenibacillus endoradicis]|uniref:DNA-3-methyladenine glycosylase n=1 Tax=Paenibacillus endoradicis TaxID=2972487 RepID=UPI0021599907|nr:DNA-3-methyladenine glycosylase [Paenibacillus endoradicis]MCR8656973.1 DNA-3-methyladenine glycosylase [Paenibacillus endoradicis]